MKNRNVKYMIASALDANRDETSRSIHAYGVAKARGLIKSNASRDVFYTGLINGCDEDEILDCINVVLKYKCHDGHLELSKVDGGNIIIDEPLVIKLPNFVNNVSKIFVTETLMVINISSLLNMGISYEDIPYNDKVIDVVGENGNVQ